MSCPMCLARMRVDYRAPCGCIDYVCGDCHFDTFRLCGEHARESQQRERSEKE